MPVTVVDASALAAFLFREPDGPAVQARLTGARLTAPLLLGFEIANICATKIRRDRAKRRSFLEALDVFRELAIAEVPVDQAQVVTLAARSELTAYDASYLWLSLQLGAELVTLDKALQRAVLRARES